MFFVGTARRSQIIFDNLSKKCKPIELWLDIYARVASKTRRSVIRCVYMLNVYIYIYIYPVYCAENAW